LELKLKYDVEDRVFKNKRDYGFIKDIKGYRIIVLSSSSSSMEKSSGGLPNLVMLSILSGARRHVLDQTKA
jgi:hypothetical protein